MKKQIKPTEYKTEFHRIPGFIEREGITTEVTVNRLFRSQCNVIILGVHSNLSYLLKMLVYLTLPPGSHTFFKLLEFSQFGYDLRVVIPSY